MRKLTKKQEEAVEREALKLYDRYNPEPDREIKVSKHECLKKARAKLFPSTNK